MTGNQQYIKWILLFFFVLFIQAALFSRSQWYSNPANIGGVVFIPVHKSQYSRLPNHLQLTANDEAAYLSSSSGESNPVSQGKDVPFQNKRMPSFHLYQDLPVSNNCPHTESNKLACRCNATQHFLDHLASEQTHNEDADMYIVPMDQLAILPHNLSDFSERVMEVVNNVTKRFSYLHYGGSDHVFLCLLPGCDRVMGEVLNSHPMGKDTRAIWVGTESDVKSLQLLWPCPNRVISVPGFQLMVPGTSQYFCLRPSTNILDQGLKILLDRTSALNYGARRWACSRKKWKFDLDSFDGHMVRGCLLVERHKLCVAGLPKCATSTMIYLLRRMNGMVNWNSSDANMHNEKNGLVWVHSEDNYTKYKEVMGDPTWVKIIITRDPTERFYSAYMDRVYRRHELRPLHYHNKGIPNLSWVIQHLARLEKANELCDVDVHYRPAHCYHDLGRIRYDYVGRVDSLYDDLEEILTQLGLWDKYCTQGWGDGTQGLRDWAGQNIGVEEKPNDTFSAHGLRLIEKLYQDDYGFWAYPLPGNISKWIQ